MTCLQPAKTAATARSHTEWCLLACAAASARGLGLAVTRSYGSYDDATLAGFTRRVGAAFVAWPHHRPPQAR